jgi:type I restriction-modification system DNA methylase subunit
VRRRAKKLEAEAHAQAPEKIIELMEKFERDQDIYRSSQYNETELRTEFINPFFEALGWDVYHKQECRADKREVKEEDAVDVEGKIKNPDYSFRLFEKRKFFVEVKRPSINIESGVYPAYQIRRYAWSADLAMSILTDFEEFSVYYCRARPSKDDKSTKSRLLYFRYDQYAEKWPEIAALFSREAVLNGSLDKYVQSLPQKRGEKRVDAALLDDISEWREMLAESIARHNPELDTVSLNYAVQTIIDRIIFLRICEDRGIERYMLLKDLLSGERVYPRLCELFMQADERYNSGIFHFGNEPGRENPDTITPGLVIDDETLKNIIKHLYFPESPYEFSVLPAEILGQIYEQFLGKVIRLDEGHNALVEDKPEVKKAGGVKYTPAYIVEYIVQNTIAPLLEGKTLQEAAALRVLDPACGSGSFLIVAYQNLLDWHKEWYMQNLVPLMLGGRMAEIKKLLPAPAAPPTKARKGRSPEMPVYQGKGEEWKLTTAERKRILLNNIFGVDIDRQAVEVTKLSLLLKVLEGENEETISKQLKLFAERALPDLSRNIKCGNSLVGWDILKDNPGLSGEEIARINPFDWEREFPEVFQSGGFDVVIGNPPYIRIQMMKEWAPFEVEHYKEKFISASTGNYDIYVVFVEQGLSLLNKNGRMGFILPHKFFNAKYGQPLRALLTGGNYLSEIVHFGDKQIFEGATTYTNLLFLDKSGSEEFRFVKVEDLSAWRNAIKADGTIIPSNNATEHEWNFATGLSLELLDKLSRNPTKLLNAASRIAQGIRTSANEIYVMELISKSSDGKIVHVKSKLLDKNFEIERNVISLFLQGREIKPYSILPSSKVVIIPYDVENGRMKFICKEEMQNKYPKTYQYLLENKIELEEREHGKMKGDSWYAYVYPKNLEVMKACKILVPDIANRGSFALDELGEYSFTSGYGIILKSDLKESVKFVLGLLNSKVLDFYLKRISTTMRGGFFRYFAQYLEQLPIRTIDFSDPADVARHARMVSLVEKMLSLNKQLPEAATPHEKTALERQIEATDGQIDALVYELYGLTEEEIGIVEGKAGSKKVSI